MGLYFYFVLPQGLVYSRIKLESRVRLLYILSIELHILHEYNVHIFTVWVNFFYANCDYMLTKIMQELRNPSFYILWLLKAPTINMTQLITHINISFTFHNWKSAKQPVPFETLSTGTGNWTVPVAINQTSPQKASSNIASRQDTSALFQPFYPAWGKALHLPCSISHMQNAVNMGCLVRK